MHIVLVNTNNPEFVESNFFPTVEGDKYASDVIRFSKTFEFYRTKWERTINREATLYIIDSTCPISDSLFEIQGNEKLLYIVILKQESSTEIATLSSKDVEGLIEKEFPVNTTTNRPEYEIIYIEKSLFNSQQIMKQVETKLSQVILDIAAKRIAKLEVMEYENIRFFSGGRVPPPRFRQKRNVVSRMFSECKCSIQ